MECNRDEALRAKEIAEKKLLEKDIRGARKFAVKAQNLNPGLDGISQMMKTLDVYLAAEKTINGEGNWYGILGLDRVADEDAVRKQFRKLALMLHPDKNKTVGAEGAFKIISEAWSLLSDKNKKLAYDERIAAVQNGIKKPGSSSAHMQSGFYDLTKRSAPHMKVPKAKSDKGGPSSAPSPSSHKQEKHTFWTVCHQCKMQYEYLKIYRNKNLLCPNCHVAFFAVKIPSPSSEYSKRSIKSHQSQQQKNLHRDEVKKKAPSTNKGNPGIPNGRTSGISPSYPADGSNFQWVPFSSNPSGMSATQAATMVQQAYERVRREREEAQAATKREQLLHKERKAHKRASGNSAYFDTVKRRRVSDDISMNDLNKKRREGIAIANTSSLSDHGNGDYGPDGAKFGKSKNVCHFSIKKLLIDKVRKDIKNRLTELNSSKFATMVESGKENSNGEDRDNGMALNKSKCNDELDTGNHDSHCLATADSLKYRSHNYILHQPSIVPDSDFHDFGRNRLEETFRENQAWAAFDDTDGMPRCYAMIHKVISLFPFKIQINWLYSKTDVKCGFGCGFLKTTGDFRLGRREIIDSIDCFSHEVKWTKEACGIIQIFPRKGDVWALYRNWSAEWDEFTEDDVIRKYDLVEILEDYNEEGVIVIPLIKVAGFKALFHRHLDLGEIRRIPSKEIFRFSHHVPSYVVTGKRCPKVPIGCRELDPAATPSELLEFMMDTNEELMEVDGVENNDDTISKEHSDQYAEELVST